ncbi:MAG: hypothetical protein LBN30_09785 [Oscillospiraceae bacterium]|jgi:hypothetical protein|nr:hypothetical protein [Oscillospiraceae bacterium]
MAQSYNPNAKSARDYDASVLTEPVDRLLSERYINVTLLCMLILWVPALVSLLFARQSSWFIPLLLASLIPTILLSFVRIALTQIAIKRQKVLASQNTATIIYAKPVPKLSRFQTAMDIIVILLGVAALFVLIFRWKHVESVNMQFVPFFILMCGNSINFPRDRAPLVFLDGGYVSCGYTIDYGRITDLRPKDEYDLDLSSFPVLLYSGDKLVGRDVMYREDYEYLQTRIGIISDEQINNHS